MIHFQGKVNNTGMKHRHELTAAPRTRERVIISWFVGMTYVKWLFTEWETNEIEGFTPASNDDSNNHKTTLEMSTSSKTGYPQSVLFL